MPPPTPFPINTACDTSSVRFPFNGPRSFVLQGYRCWVSGTGSAELWQTQAGFPWFPFNSPRYFVLHRHCCRASGLVVQNSDKHKQGSPGSPLTFNGPRYFVLLEHCCRVSGTGSAELWHTQAGLPQFPFNGSAELWPAQAGFPHSTFPAHNNYLVQQTSPGHILPTPALSAQWRELLRCWQWTHSGECPSRHVNTDNANAASR